jgi:hypothetical protein
LNSVDLQPCAQVPDALADQSAVGLELGLARPTQADAAFLALEVGPAPHQAGRKVAQLGQFDFELALVGACALGEDVEDQRGAVQHPALARFLDIAFLDRAQWAADQHEVRAVHIHRLGEFLDLSLANEIPRVGAVTGRREHGHDLGTRRERQLVEFIESVRAGTGKTGMQDNRAVAALSPFKQGRTRSTTLPTLRLRRKP